MKTEKANKNKINPWDYLLAHLLSSEMKRKLPFGKNFIEYDGQGVFMKGSWSWKN